MNTFLARIDTHGTPASTLTDNGRAYTARHGGGRNAFEYLLAALNKRVLILADEHTTTVIHLDTGEIIATNTINTERNYWRNEMKEPGRWPGSS